MPETELVLTIARKAGLSPAICDTFFSISVDENHENDIIMMTARWPIPTRDPFSIRHPSSQQEGL